MEQRWRVRPRPSNWGDFGADDQRGRLNLIDKRKVLDGIAEVREGRVFCLSLPLDYPGGNYHVLQRRPPLLQPVVRNGREKYNLHANPKHTDVFSDDYDAPGWTANGVEPWGVQMDPIGADGMLFYKGFFLVLLGIRALVAADDRWNTPFAMIRDGDNSFTWTHSTIAAHLADQWRRMPKGVHCENTKIWPY